MKRTNLVLNELLLETATQVLGMKTYSAAVNKALEEAIRMARIRNLSHFVGKSLWEGDLSQMRDDKKRTPLRRRKKIKVSAL